MIIKLIRFIAEWDFVKIFWDDYCKILYSVSTIVRFYKSIKNLVGHTMQLI